MERAASSSDWKKQQTEQEGGCSHTWSFQNYSTKGMDLKETRCLYQAALPMPECQLPKTTQQSARLAPADVSNPLMSLCEQNPNSRVFYTLSTNSSFPYPYSLPFNQPKDPAGTKTNVNSVNTNTDYFYTTVFFKHFQNQQSSQNVTKWILALTPVTSESMTQS